MPTIPIHDSTPLLDVRGVGKSFPVRRGLFSRVTGEVRAVEDVSFRMSHGEILGLVGESGCGKSTLGRIVLHLLRPSTGSVRFEGMEIAPLRGDALKRYRKRAQIIFQDPHSSLNPRMTIGAAIGEALMTHDVVPRRDVEARIVELLETVGLNGFHAKRYPHEFSSGQRQRIGIARALSVEPTFIVCDEPVSALDVSIQAQILNLLLDLRERFSLAYLFISHDLGVVKHISDRIAVMYLGSIVEAGTAEQVMHDPLHPYTAALISSAPIPDPRRRKDRLTLAGDVPLVVAPPAGCPFQQRCPQALPSCETVTPVDADLGDGHHVRCLLYEPCDPGYAAFSPAAAVNPAHAPAHGLDV